MRRAATLLAAALLVPSGQAHALDEPPPNTAPVAQSDAASVRAGEAVEIPVLANDTDDGVPGPLTVVSTTGDARVTFTPEVVTFRAAPTDTGTATFDYVVSDGELTATATVTVTITPLPRSVSLTVPALVALRASTLRGAVAPVRSVAVSLERKTSGKPWQTVARTTTDSAGRFAFSQRPTRLQLLRFRAVAEGVRSAVVSREVTAKPDLVVSGPLQSSDVRHSYRTGCPVGPAQLRRVTVNHVTYSGRVRRGRVVVSARAVPAVKAMLVAALRRGFPFKQLVPAEHFYAGGRRTPTGSDLAAMRADNTSAFNCRTVTGNPYRLSQHSYGNAIDVNTVRNPYVTASRVYPSFARTYLRRGHAREGMLFRSSIVTRVLRARGWLWGARWAHPDYQHFSSNGG